jgi:biopolymer transport protein ExbD
MRMRLAAIIIAAFGATACFGGSDAAEIHLAADGTITLNGEPTTLEALADAEVLRGDDPQVRLSADPDVAYRHVHELQRTLQTLDLDRVIFDMVAPGG